MQKLIARIFHTNLHECPQFQESSKINLDIGFTKECNIL